MKIIQKNIAILKVYVELITLNLGRIIGTSIFINEVYGIEWYLISRENSRILEIF